MKVGTCLNNIAGLLESQYRYAEAEKYYRHALEVAEKAFGPDHPNTATSLTNLAGTLISQEKYRGG